jgi:hypothetical protein
MNISKKSVVFSLILSVFFGFVIIVSVRAQSSSITQTQSELIVANCTTLKATLNQLHSNDALLRVNAGQTYESILTKLMKRFNERANSSNMVVGDLEAATADFEALLNIFRTNYVAYEQQLSATININCMLRPQAFYDYLALTRERRNALHSSVQELNLAMDYYIETLNKFELDNQAAIERLSR